MNPFAASHRFRLSALPFFALFAIAVAACGSESTGAVEHPADEESQAITIHVPDSQELGAASSACVPKNCATVHTTACGPIANGCGGTIECAACINGTECVNGECVVPPWYYLCQECVRTGGHCVTINNVHTCKH